MFTVIETLLFQKQWPLYWNEEERGEFAAHIAAFPNAGDVVPQSGGVRVIYFTHNAEQEVVLLLMYSKSATDNITGQKLKEIRRVLEN
jgi:hypothetical protein